MKVIFIIRVFRTEKVCVCQNLSEVIDFNEFTSHLQRVMLTYYHRTKGYLKRDEQQRENKENKGGNVKNSNQMNDILENATLDTTDKVHQVVTELCKTKKPVAFDEISKAFGETVPETTLK